MIYQFLRVALCAALLTGTTANAVGKRALWNFIEAKKELQKKLAELRKMDATADVDRSSMLADEIQAHIDEVKKLDPTKAAEFQEILDASFEQEVGALSLEAQSMKAALTNQIAQKADQLAKNKEKLEQAVMKNEPVLFEDGNVSNETKTIPGIKAAKEKGYLTYLSFVTVPVSFVTYPFTRLITKSYKMSLRLLDFITGGRVEKIHNTYLGIMQQEKDALIATIVNTSMVAASKINGFLNRINVEDEQGQKDLTEKLLPQEKRWFLGKVYDKAKTVASSLRTKDTFSGSQLHSIVLGELLEYNALLTPLIDFAKHTELEEQMLNMNAGLANVLHFGKIKTSLTADEKNLFAALFEMNHTLESANEESKKILDPETKKPVYPEGKLSRFFTFAQNNAEFKVIFTTAGIDTAKMIDTRSCKQKLQDVIAAKKIGAYKEEFAAVAGLVLTIAGGSYLVEQYLPKYKNKYTAYAAAPINYVLSILNNYFGTSDKAKQSATTTLTFIKSKIKQLPYSDKISNAISYSWVKAMSVATRGARLMSGLYARVRGQEHDAFQAADKEWESQQTEYLKFYDGDPQAQQAFEEGQHGMDPNTYEKEAEAVEQQAIVTGDNVEDLGLLFGNQEPAVLPKRTNEDILRLFDTPDETGNTTPPAKPVQMEEKDIFI